MEGRVDWIGIHARGECYRFRQNNKLQTLPRNVLQCVKQ